MKPLFSLFHFHTSQAQNIPVDLDKIFLHNNYFNIISAYLDFYFRIAHRRCNLHKMGNFRPKWEATGKQFGKQTGNLVRQMRSRIKRLGNQASFRNRPGFRFQ